VVHIRYVWQGTHPIYGHIRCIYMVLANPRSGLMLLCFLLGVCVHATVMCVAWGASCVCVRAGVREVTFSGAMLMFLFVPCVCSICLTFSFPRLPYA